MLWIYYSIKILRGKKLIWNKFNLKKKEKKKEKKEEEEEEEEEEWKHTCILIINK